MAGDLKAYYERKVAEGKHKMSVMSSMRNKLILRVLLVCEIIESIKKIMSMLLHKP